MLLRIRQTMGTMALTAALILFMSTGSMAAVTAPLVGMQVAPALALCISPAMLFGMAFTAPMLMLAIGFAAVLATDRMS